MTSISGLDDTEAAAGIGAITDAAAALFATHGPIGAPPRGSGWGPEALEVVRRAWREATDQAAIPP